MDREADILELCKQVLNASPKSYYNPNGPDDSTCPFCFSYVLYAEAEIGEIEHKRDCAYLIAKDLSTGLIKPLFSGDVPKFGGKQTLQ